MRKTSQDGGDSTSITSGLENDIKKVGATIKSKKTSIKRKVQNLSHESEDGVIEPLLQKDKEKTEASSLSAKFNLLSKMKTDVSAEKKDDKERLLQDDKTQKTSLSDTPSVVNTVNMIPSSSILPKSTVALPSLHNHMNTNVFINHDDSKGFIAPKSQVLVEIDACKQSGYSPSPLIFTTAKIHTDSQIKHMEPLQVTPVPILSTIEVNALKGITVNSNGIATGPLPSNDNLYGIQSNKNTLENGQKTKSFLPADKQMSHDKFVDTKVSTFSDKNPVPPMKDFKVTDSEPKITTDNKSLRKQIIYDDTKPATMSKMFPSHLSSPSGSVTQVNEASCKVGNKPTITIPSAKNETYIISGIDKNKVCKNLDKMDLNKNFKDSSPSENVPDAVSGTSKDKNTIDLVAANKVLQRQKETIENNGASNNKVSKVQSYISDKSISKEPELTEKVNEFSVPNTIMQVNDKVRAKSFTNGVPTTSHIINNSNKTPPVTSNSTNNKSPISTTVSYVKPNKSSDNSNSKKAAPLLTGNFSSTSVAVAKSDIKSKDIVSSSSPQSTNIKSNKSFNPIIVSEIENPKTSLIDTNVKLTNTSVINKTKESKEIGSPSVPGNTVSSSNTASPKSSINTSVVTSSTINTPVLTNIKAQSVSSKTGKNVATTLIASKTPSTNTVKSSFPSMTTTKNISASNPTVKAAIEPASTFLASPATTKNLLMSVKTTKGPETTNNSKSTLVHTGNIQIPSAASSGADTLSNTQSVTVASSATKSTTISTTSAKPSVSTTDIKISGSKTNTTPISQTNAATNTTAVTSICGSTSQSTTSSNKSEAKSTDLSNGTKSFKT